MLFRSGQALPLLKRGVPVSIVHLENVSYPETWKDVKVLVLSYSNMKPATADAHDYLAKWVKSGGVLVYCGRDNDPFQTVQEWWNTGSNNYKAPSEHLFTLLGLEKNCADGIYSCGKGTVAVLRQDPKEFVLEKANDSRFVDLVKQMYQQKAGAGQLVFKNHFQLNRGPFEIISVMDESVSSDPYLINGKLIDLFDPALPVLTQKKILPGEQAFLFNVEKVKNPQAPQVLASACRVYDEKTTKKSYSFVAKSPINTTNVMRILLPSSPKKTTVTDASGAVITGVKSEWDALSRTALLSFENNPDGVNVLLEW